MTPPPALTALVTLMGTCVGSFVTTAALRHVRSEQALWGRSRCEQCGVALGFAQTLPIVAFVRAKGACGACGGRIEPSHLVGEVAGGVIALSVLLAAPYGRAPLLAALGFVLLASAVYDARTRRLPDVLTLVAAILCGALAAQEGALVGGAAAALIAFVVLEGVRRAFLRLRRAPGLGFGDIKLIAALALWLGATTSWAGVLASVLGLVTAWIVRPSDGRIAFGPMIAFSAFVVGLVEEGGWWPA